MILNPVSCLHGADLFVPTCNTKAMRVAVKAKVGPKTAKIIEQPQTPNSPKHLQIEDRNSQVKAEETLGMELTLKIIEITSYSRLDHLPKPLDNPTWYIK